MTEHKYSICGACGKEMAPDSGCTFNVIELRNGKRHDRLPVGANGEYEGNCGDCNAGYGKYHHPGCDTAVCPVCHGQESFCDCDIKGYIRVILPKRKGSKYTLSGKE